MAQCDLITTSNLTRCTTMWNFFSEIPKRLTRGVSALIGWGAQADVMYRGSKSTQHGFQTERTARGVHPIFLCLVGFGTVQPVFVVFAAERCPAANATKVVSVQGNVSWSVINNATLQTAKLNDILCVGDTVRVGVKSRAVLRLPNETTIPLDQNTVFQLKEAISEKDPTLIELIQGAIHVITRTPKPFKVNTPYLNAAVEGTEFYVGVDASEAKVAVIEGKVNVSNEQGAVLLIDNEAATARKGQAPQKTLTIKPRDAVQWALYYPPLFDPRSRVGGENLAASYEHYSQGDITGAIENLDAIPASQRNEDYATYRAGLLLLVGRADEAEPEIERALLENGNNTDALSLKAIIAIVKNDKLKALELANQAVNIDDKSASARIALSYALQANFKIEDALKAAREATLRDADNALAWARVAELELSIPNYDKSKDAAEKAVKLNPSLARTQSILGFAYLTRIDLKAAKDSFSKAIELDQADPLPRLGLGLATLRGGSLEQGREQIEIAASLDPENSLIRSYLGKAYYEEKRDDNAAKQFVLAKERDPKDPTPHFYDAIREQVDNRPVTALVSLSESVMLNRNRAVYRSKLLIDDDAAAREATSAYALAQLGFERLAIAESVKALADSQSNYSAHRLLSIAYSDLPRHDIARVSEALQAQIRQPLAVPSIDAQIETNNLGILREIGPSRPGINEFGSLFNRDGTRFQIDGLKAGNHTASNQISVGGLAGRFAYGVGQLHYETEGFFENNAVTRDIYQIFLKTSTSSESTIQTELKRATLEVGQNYNFFDPENIFRTRIREEADSIRLAGHLPFHSGDNLIWSISYEDRVRASEIFPDAILITTGTADTYGGEVQHVKHLGSSEIVVGASHTTSREKFPLEDQRLDTESSSVYVYSHLHPGPNDLTVEVGVAAESFRFKSSVFSTSITSNRLNPKFGLVWSPTSFTTIRAAYFSSTKRPMIGSQTLEPTQVAGFNQFYNGFDAFFGDFEGTRSRRLGVALDQRILRSTFIGAEVSARRLDVPTFSAGSFDWKENAATFYLYKGVPADYTRAFLSNWEAAIKIEYDRERLQRPQILTGSEGIVNVTTERIPIGLRLFNGDRLSMGLTTTFIRQHGSFAIDEGLPQFKRSDREWITDFSMEYRLPKRLGLISVGAKNIFDEAIDVFETDPVNPRVAKGRLAFAKFRLLF